MSAQNTPTPHISAKYGDFAKTVLMPGDPLRAKFVAENFLTDAKLVTDVRNMLGYTGKYKGKKVSVMGSGMGMPSMGIYSWELYNFYGVNNIIRIGSCGAFQDDLNLMDVIVAIAATTDSNFPTSFGMPDRFAPVADFGLVEKAVNAARAKKIPVHVGSVFSSDMFYSDRGDYYKIWKKYGLLGVEMESAALYTNAAASGKKAVCLLSVSDHIFRKSEVLSAEERQTGFANMIEIALETAI